LQSFIFIFLKVAFGSRFSGRRYKLRGRVVWRFVCSLSSHQKFQCRVTLYPPAQFLFCQFLSFHLPF